MRESLVDHLRVNTLELPGTRFLDPRTILLVHTRTAILLADTTPASMSVIAARRARLIKMEQGMGARG